MPVLKMKNPAVAGDDGGAAQQNNFPNAIQHKAARRNRATVRRLGNVWRRAELTPPASIELAVTMYGPRAVEDTVRRIAEAGMLAGYTDVRNLLGLVRAQIQAAQILAEEAAG